MLASWTRRYFAHWPGFASLKPMTAVSRGGDIDQRSVRNYQLDNFTVSRAKGLIRAATA